MDGMPTRFSFSKNPISFCSLAFAALLLVGCGNANPLSSEKARAPTVQGPGNGGSSTPVSGGEVVDQAGFFLSVTNTNISYTLHQADDDYGEDIETGNFSTSCKIDNGQTDQDITCVLEIGELDLYFNDLNIQYHVPSSMCSYLKVEPYHFWAYEPGTGPSLVSYEVTAAGTVIDHANSVNGTPDCVYDYTDTSGPNCCVGTYAKVVIDSGAGTVTTTAEEWTGTTSSCLGGPAMSTQTIDQGTGFPLPSFYYIEGEGYNQTYTITAAKSVTEVPGISRTVESSIYAANFYKPSQHADGKPPGLRLPPAITVAAQEYEPHDTYEFQCLDRANDVTNRIRLFIREWDEVPIAQGGDPDTGWAASPPYPTEPVSGELINDNWDWRDFGELYPASSM